MIKLQNGAVRSFLGGLFSGRFFSGLLSRLWRWLEKPCSFRWALLVFTITSLLRLVVHLSLQWPIVLGDELSYKLMAFDYHKSGLFASPFEVYAATRFPNNVFPFLTSFFFDLQNLTGFDFYSIVKTFNTLCIFSSLCLLFLLVTRLDLRKLSLVEVLILSRIPSFHYDGAMMIEPLLFLIFTVWLYWSAKLTLRSNWKSAIGAGLMSGLALNTKPTMIAPLLALILFNFYRAWRELGERRKILTNLFVVGVVCVISSLAIFLALNRGMPTLSSLGIYETHAAHIIAPEMTIQNIGATAMVAIGLLGGLAIIFYPFALSFLLVKEPALNHARRNEGTLFWLVLLMLVMMMGLVAQFTMAVKETGLLHFRYVSVLLPVLTIALLRLQPFQLKWPWRVLTGSLLVLSLAVFWIQFARDSAPAFTTSFIEMSWIALFHGQTILICFALVTVMLIFILRKASVRGVLLAQVAWLLIGYNLANWTMANAILNTGSELDQALAPAFDCVGDQELARNNLSVGIISPPGYANILASGRIAFRLESELKFFSPLQENGTIENLNRATDADRLAVLKLVSWKLPLDFPHWKMIKDSRDCSIYERE